jgi:hypothetical protein
MHQESGSRQHKTCSADKELKGGSIFARRLIDTVLGITCGNLRMCGCLTKSSLLTLTIPCSSQGYCDRNTEIMDGREVGLIVESW